MNSKWLACDGGLCSVCCSTQSVVLAGFADTSQWASEELLRDWEGPVWALSIPLCPILMPVIFQCLLSILCRKKPHPLQQTVPRRVFCHRILRASVSSGFVSCGISDRGRAERCLGQGCLPALFLSSDGRILTWPLRPPRSYPAHCRLSPHESWASTSWHFSSSWEEKACSQRGRNRRIKGVSAMVVLSFHLVTSWINLF